MIVICWQTRILRLRNSLSLSQVARCLTLLEMNMAAARTFYQLVVAHLPPSHVVRFMLALYTTVRHAVGEGEEEEEDEREETKKKKKARGGGAKKRGRKDKVEDGLKNHASNGELSLSLSLSLRLLFTKKVNFLSSTGRRNKRRGGGEGSKWDQGGRVERGREGR